ncbi:enolase C-terminal domain-like protein [Curtobacterium sp. MCSS17_016]|uniref:enolase C-terminal domain-like protein n=1 Tax=Curtobacterium sp. MCSS17_016 TaxID=2175644 RepID=UPI000DA95080|nr:enolase C-terminal domain-like protein [Curtobacterium sp. MCSS17_016]WIE80549.1 enolase C-terminal domain-like protein [Curtobacterium sp. MCSS17_016]
MNADRVDAVTLTAYRFPTTLDGRARAEQDGTAEWDSTGVFVAEVRAGDTTGLGYAYTSADAALTLARELLVPTVLGTDPLDTHRAFRAMARALRNAGWVGVGASALSALDVALHDCAARRLGVSMTRFLGGARDRVAAYGSGGFTDFSTTELVRQLEEWRELGLHSVKIKVGRDPQADPGRVREARGAVGEDVALFVDANGAYHRREAIAMAERFTEQDVTWFEEPVSSDDLRGLRDVRDRTPSGIRVTAGEYGYTPTYFHAMLDAGAVDVLQADATRCGGVTGFLSAAAQAEAAGIPLSAHTAPALHASIATAVPNVVHVERFHDHALIEEQLFDGLPDLRDGSLVPDRDRPGHGLELRSADVEPYLTGRWATAGGKDI